MPKSTAPAAVAIPPDVEAVIDQKITRQVESSLAARPGPAAPAVLKYKGMFDTERPALAMLGLRLKKAFIEFEDQNNRDKSKNAHLRDFLDKAKAAGVFESVFNQGGSLWAKETMSEEIIDALRPASILLRAGARTESGYGSKLVIGVINQGVTVAWEGEMEDASESNPDTGDLVLGAHKVMGTTPISNSLMRKGTLKSAEQIANDLVRAIALGIDQAGLFGKGPKKPTGILNTAGITKSAISGVTTAQKIADLKQMIADVLAANITLEGANPFYFMTSGTMMSLSNERDTAGWVFPGLQNFQAPTINGYPVFSTESLAGKQVMGFGLAQELYFGNAAPLEIELGENGNDFKKDRKTLRGVQEVDWVVRRAKAFSVRTGVSY